MAYHLYLGNSSGGASPDVTVALTGQSLTASAGSLSSVIDCALAGAAIVLSLGTITADISTVAALTGESVSISQGSVSTTCDIALTGQSLTAGQGTLTPTNSADLSGQSLSVAQESITQSSAGVLSGQAAVIGQDSLLAANTEALTGQELVISQDSVTASTGVFAALTGQGLSVSQGSVLASNTNELLGQSLSVFNVGIAERHILVPALSGIGHEINGVLASSEALSVYRQSFVSGGTLLLAEAGDARTDTGYPVIESVTETTFAVDATAHAVSMPATVNTGDGLIVILTTDGSATVTTPIGWKQLYTEANGTALRGSAYAKVGRGTEGGTTVDFITSATENAAAQVYRISNWNGTLAGIQAGTVGEVTTGTTADPASVTAYWGSAKNIWLATCHTSTSQTISSGPASYTNLTQTSSAAATTGAQCISARRSREIATEDPDVFTTSGTGASKVYNTIAIAPAYVGAYYEHFEITNGTTLWVGAYTSQPLTVADTGITRAVIVLHGNGLDAAEYQNVVQNNLVDYLGKVVVIAPFFAESESDPETDQLFWGASWPELGRSDASLAWRISSGGVLDELIDHLYTTFVNIEGIVIAGHSAGGQLCNRYSSASSDTRNRYLVSAPSSYVYPGIERTDGAGGWAVPGSPSTYNDWKYGLDILSTVSYVDAIGAAALRARLAAAKVHYMVGALDNDPADTSMDLTADAAVQGAHRVERQQLYHSYLNHWYITYAPSGSVVIAHQEALNGQSVVIGQGSLLTDSSLAITGQAVTIEQGTITASAPGSATLSGQELVIGQGSVLTTNALVLTGESLAASQGTITATTDTIAALTGQSVTVSGGSLVQSSSASLAGGSAQVAAGTLTASNSEGVTGQDLTAANGSLVQSSSAELTGQVVVIEQGSTSASVPGGATLSGQSLSVAQGTTLSDTSIELSGQSLSVSQGSIAQSSSCVLSGQELVVNQGSILAAGGSVSAALSGQNLSINQGSITGGTSQTVPVSYDIIVSLAETDITVSYLTTSITVDLAVTNIEVSG